MKTFKFNPNDYWTPKIYFENALGDVKSEIIYKLQVSSKIDETFEESLTIVVTEQRFIKGAFHEV